MAIIQCDNCGKPMLTEADLFVYQSRPEGLYHSCGCLEFGLALELVESALKDSRPNTDIARVLCGIKTELELFQKTGHILEKPANQYCVKCKLPMFTAAASKPCQGS